MITPVSIRLTDDDKIALEAVRKHYAKILETPPNTTLLYRMAMKKLADAIKTENNQRG
jgi:hypothetical protein